MGPRSLAPLALVAALTFGAAGDARAELNPSYDVKIDTSSFTGTSGYLDFPLNPGGSDASAVTAASSSIVTDGRADPVDKPTLTGDASGAVPTGVTLDNRMGFDEQYQAFAFGKTFEFHVNPTGPIDPSSASGTDFAFAMYDKDVKPLLSSDPSGQLLRTSIDGQGNLATQQFNDHSPPRPSPARSVRIGRCSVADDCCGPPEEAPSYGGVFTG